MLEFKLDEQGRLIDTQGKWVLHQGQPVHLLPLIQKLLITAEFSQQGRLAPLPRRYVTPDDVRKMNSLQYQQFVEDYKAGLAIYPQGPDSSETVF